MYELERELEVLGGVFFLGGFTFASVRQLAWEHIFLMQFRTKFIGGWSSVFSSLLLHYSSLNVPHERLERLPGPLLLQEPGTTMFCTFQSHNLSGSSQDFSFSALLLEQQ